jgi:hypothetical protein
VVLKHYSSYKAIDQRIFAPAIKDIKIKNKKKTQSYGNAYIAKYIDMLETVWPEQNKLVMEIANRLFE